MKDSCRFLILCFFLCSAMVQARDYLTYTLTKSDGLSDTYVRDVVQDGGKGCLWFATLNGLNQYDGYTMTNVITRKAMQNDEIPDNRIAKVYSWGKNYIWVKLRGDIYACYDLQRQRFVFHTNSRNPRETYRSSLLLADQVWLMDASNGCMRISVDNQRFVSKSYTAENHLLPSSHVNTVRQGAQGNVWIATNKGLVWVEHGGKSRIIDAKYNIMYIVTCQGKDFFVTEDGKILAYSHGKLSLVSKTSHLPSGLKVKGAFACRGNVFVATTGKVYECNSRNAILRERGDIPVSDAKVVEDNRGNILLANKAGQVYYFSKSYDFYCKLPFGVKAIREDLNFKAVTTSDQQVMISTKGFGLFIIDLKNLMKTNSHQAVADHYPTKSNNVLSIYEDRQGNVWVLQEDVGALCLEKSQVIANFASFEKTGSIADLMEENMVRMLKKSKDGRIYACSQNGKLSVFDNKDLVAMGTQYGNVLSHAVAHGGESWWGTRDGVYIDNKKYAHDKKTATSLSSNKVSDILCDHKNRMWLACYGGGLDLARYVNGNWQFAHFFNQTREVKEARVLLQDHKGKIWLGTGEGVFVFDPDQLIANKTKGQHLTINRNPKMDEIHAIMEDSKHRVWVAITGTGVALYDNTGNQPRLVKVFSHADGLGDNNVQSFVEDNQGRIWVGNNYGVSYCHEKKGYFNNYLISYSMQGNRCMENAACKLDNGMIAFGTKEGVAYFYPSQVARNSHPSQASVTFMMVNGIPLEQLEEDQYSKDGNHYYFSHSQNSLLIKFSDFSFDRDHGSQYSYWLEGFDREWSVASGDPSASYKNLPPGTYTFHLRNSDNQGNWSKEKACLKITIHPPFWATWYAWILYVLIISLVIYYVWRQLEDKRQLMEKIRLEQQLTNFKVHFFTNISHEFRTPLTIILGAMDNIRDKGELPGSIKQPISNMLKSTQRMKRLIDRLLDFTKVQERKVTLHVEKTEVVGFARDLWSYFKQIAQNKQIEYQFSTFSKEMTLPIDKKKVDTILCNLLSNAIKYTPSKGEVTLRIEKDGKADELLFQVIDNGIGIKEEKRKQLFDRFMQSSFSYDSIGIGLYLSSQLAQLHHGSISYEARPSGGSIFTLHIPASEKAYAQHEFVQQETAPIIDEHKEKAWLEEYKEIAGKSLNDKRVLVVEDDDDVMNFLSQELKSYFVIQTACNGKEALEKLEEGRPDLIISDVMMHVMDGYELTRKLKTDDRYDDIPVILLTALNEDAKKAKGYDAGADDYIEKPFSMKMLVSRCVQLMQQHDKLKARYSQMSAEEPQKVQTIIKEERDKKFIDILDGWIARHMSDPGLNIDTLASSLSYGRSTFYTKVSSLTGMTPNNYVRKKRLEAGKRMLEDSNDTVAEISYKTGFSNPYYFSKCFKQEFGISPSTYRKGN